MSNRETDRSREISDTIPLKQRAIIFQGGVALGAYETGVFRKLYDVFYPQLHDDENLFDIVAGSSVGGINAAILVSHVRQRKKKLGNGRQHTKASWEGAADKLDYYWKRCITPSLIELNPMLLMLWEYFRQPKLSASLKTITKEFVRSRYAAYRNFPFANEWYEWLKFWLDLYETPATAEGARRYFSALQFNLWGAPRVFASIHKWDTKYVFGSAMFRSRIDNQTVPLYSLKDFLDSEFISKNGEFTKIIEFPIATTYEDNDPRLLLVSVDIENSETVTFDSHQKRDRSRKSEYSSFDPKKNVTIKHRIKYDKGIEWDHLSAGSASNYSFRYPTLNDDAYERTTGASQQRTFWDGTFLSNTPMRQTIHEHKEFWKGYIEDHDGGLWDGRMGTEIPKLDIAIVSVWPTRMQGNTPVQSDNDFIEERLLDLNFHDKTVYDEKVTKMISDYLDIISKLLQVAKNHDIVKVEKGNTAVAMTVQQFLDSEQPKSLMTEEKKVEEPSKWPKYRDLIKGRVKVGDVVRIELEDDADTISLDLSDYSYGTIMELYKKGHQGGSEKIKELKPLFARTIDAKKVI